MTYSLGKAATEAEEQALAAQQAATLKAPTEAEQSARDALIAEANFSQARLSPTAQAQAVARTAQAQAQAVARAAGGMSTGTKVAIGVGAAALVAGIAYVALRPKASTPTLMVKNRRRKSSRGLRGNPRRLAYSDDILESIAGNLRGLRRDADSIDFMLESVGDGSRAGLTVPRDLRKWVERLTSEELGVALAHAIDRFPAAFENGIDRVVVARDRAESVASAMLFALLASGRFWSDVPGADIFFDSLKQVDAQLSPYGSLAARNMLGMRVALLASHDWTAGFAVPLEANRRRKSSRGLHSNSSSDCRGDANYPCGECARCREIWSRSYDDMMRKRELHPLGHAEFCECAECKNLRRNGPAVPYDDQKHAVAVTKGVLREVFGDTIDHISDEEMDDAVVPASDDRGQWSPRAAAIIYVENGFPGDYTEYGMELWQQVGAELEDAGLYFEPVNSAVFAVYPV